ncbi:glycosyltransferase family 1 protein [candidate division WS5 bacterium]|uniref:Glycosyltransferase family 1 protein n=1 Tax=candidate division WS5 bacterium TaxID=2093353 RepID=A0A419DGB3_9BACT|nr:MAG: glycosyltransferase family 1 protein [candidate division WS5 bacterium]
MRIIFASTFYYRRGGLEAYLFKVKELLEQHGHEVIPFSTNHYKNDQSNYAEYFCTYYDLSQKGVSQHTLSSKVQAVMNMFFNAEAYRNIKNLCTDIKPDIVQGFGVARSLSYSIFKAAKSINIPTVMRLSDYSLLCPNILAMDGWGEICSDFACSRQNLLKILRRKCIHNSMAATLIGELEFMFNTITKTYKKHVDYFIAPSRFLQRAFIKYFNLAPERIIYLPIFFDCTNIQSSETDEGYFLYAGRMSREKGVMTLLRAAGKGNRPSLILAGMGPKEKEFREYADKHNLNVRFVGFQGFKDLQSLIKNCRAVIVPSECYENSPNIVLEAYAYGKPVIGSYIGGIPEIVLERETGLTFQAGNENDLNEKIEYLYKHKDIARAMGENARVFLEKEWNAEKHYHRLMEFYKIAKGHDV